MIPIKGIAKTVKLGMTKTGDRYTYYFPVTIE